MPGCSWRGHLQVVHYCLGVFRGDTYKGYITARVFLEGTPTRDTLLLGCSWRGHLQGVHYCPGVLGGDTYKGYITAQVFLEGTPVTGVHILFINAGYALTANPTIFVSLSEQFWQTATVKRVIDREQ
ncbi:hypothetical protein Tco_0814656 [Tanacetum coccineum]|uniref:Pectinesterase n=1 Tax=Tanacetum coccineum TaxID=301880 RepID=A0ABQ4Z8Y2_9ASTR